MLLKKSIPIKRNAPCPCGSRRKLKHCCIRVVKEVSAAVNAGVSQETIMTRQLFQEPLLQEQDGDV